MISSTQNARIRELVRLKKSAKQRALGGVFWVEGPKMFREIPLEMFREVYVSESFSLTPEGKKDLEKARMAGCAAEIVSDYVFQYLSDTKSPQGVLAVVSQLQYKLQDLTGRQARPDYKPDGLTGQNAPLIVILENLQDPGNLGTILRTAEASGATGILLSRGCADIYSPKVTRSTMGSIFRVPFVYTDDLEGALRYLKGLGLRIYAAHLQGSVDLYEEDGAFTAPTAFLIGNESRGLTKETAALADRAVRIPMSGSVESLNAAVAAAVMMYEAKRQRR